MRKELLEYIIHKQGGRAQAILKIPSDVKNKPPDIKQLKFPCYSEGCAGSVREAVMDAAFDLELETSEPVIVTEINHDLADRAVEERKTFSKIFMVKF